MKTAGALTLVVWLVVVVALCLVPVQHRVREASRLDCQIPVVALNARYVLPATGAFTGLGGDVVTSCRERSGMRLAAASLVGGGGLAGGLVLLREAPRARRRAVFRAGGRTNGVRRDSGRDSSLVG